MPAGLTTWLRGILYAFANAFRRAVAACWFSFHFANCIQGVATNRAVRQQRARLLLALAIVTRIAALPTYFRALLQRAITLPLLTCTVAAF